MYSIREKFQKKITFKNYSIKVIFKTFSLSLIFVLILALIHVLLTKNLVLAVVGLTPFFSGAYLLFDWKEIFKNNSNQLESKEITPGSQININTGGGNNIEKNDGNYIQGNYNKDDSVNQYINIEGKQVEISSDISETLSDFKEILTETISQSSNTLEAISGFVQELTEVFRYRPELKSYFNADKYTSNEELVNGIIKILLAQDFTQIESITNSSDLIKIKPIEVDNQIEKEYQISEKYKDYTIGFIQGNNSKWEYRIQRNDYSFLDNPNRQKSYTKERASQKAHKEIDKELTEEFHSQKTID